jgi:DNA-directed RNA polymerase specialized sigma24 family protein
LLDVLSNFSIDTGDFVTDALVFKQLLKRLDELIPNAKEIGKLRLDGFSDKAIAHKLGIPRTTMLSQLKKALNKIIQEYPDLIKF